jgi:hypothetical protein
MVSSVLSFGSAALLLSIALATNAAKADEDPTCDRLTVGKVCRCDLDRLKPLQGAVGKAEVLHKAHDVRDAVESSWEEAFHELRCDPVKVIVAPSGALYITDHHHTALAWWMVEDDVHKPKVGLCLIGTIRSKVDNQPVSVGTMDEFWTALQRDDVGLVHLKDEKGVKISPDKLPQSLAELKNHDDPYRSLAWKVRKKKGFCRPQGQVEFVEFQWGDYFRKHQGKLPEEQVSRISPRGSDDTDLVKTAVDIAKSSEAHELPGYGNRDCEKEEEKSCGKDTE